MKKILIILVPIILFSTGCIGVPGPENLVGPDTTGIWEQIVKIFSYAMIFSGKILDNNIIYGLIFTTVFVRLLMVPLYKSQIKSSSNMAKLQPDLKKLNKKYENKNSQEDKLKKSTEMQALYKRYNINPLSGCLSMLIQMPLLFAFYGSINNLLVHTQNGVKGLELYGSQDMNNSFLIWSDLGQPVIIFGILAGIATYISTKLTTYGNEQSSGANDMMKYMTIGMPIMIVFMGFTLPGALSLYWLIGNIFQIAQTLIIKRNDIKKTMDKKKLEKIK